MRREEFLKYYMEIERPLRAYLFAATGNLHETDDLSQRVWQVLWKKLDQFDDSLSFKAWSFGIARLEVLKWRQGKARSKEVLSGEVLEKLAESSQDSPERFSARHSRLLDCIGRLAGQAKRVLDWKYREGRQSAEIGKMIDRSADAVNMILSRTRKALRECIERKTTENL